MSNGNGHLQVEGELSFATAPHWWPRLTAAIAGGRQLDLDLSAVSRVDSAGLALLVSLLAEARSRQVSIALHGVQPQLLQLARVSGVEALLPIEWATEPAAP